MTELLNNQVLLLIFLFCVGLAVGSFVNVFVLRLNTGMTLRGRSRCFSCLRRLQWYDLIPLASFAAVRGRCRYCGSAISIQYPLVEFASGLIFALVGYVAGPLGPEIPGFAFAVSLHEILRYILAVAFFSTLLAIAVYDIRHKIIPDQLVVSLLGFAALAAMNYLYQFFDRETLRGDILSALGAFLFFAGFWFISRGAWMGFGDAKIAFAIGLFLGYPWTIFAILFAFWAGAVFGIGMMLFGGYGRKSEVPFAPFLAFGAFGAYMLASTDVLFWYYNLLLL